MVQQVSPLSLKPESLFSLKTKTVKNIPSTEQIKISAKSKQALPFDQPQSAKVGQFLREILFQLFLFFISRSHDSADTLLKLNHPDVKPN